jgi:hypothetical protein
MVSGELTEKGKIQMLRRITFSIALICATVPALADGQKPLTVEQCVTVLNGLSALSCAGQQLNDQTTCPRDAKQYKLGPARMTIGSNIGALSAVFSMAQRSQQEFLAELPPLPQPVAGKPPGPEIAEAETKRQAAASKNWQGILSADCNVQPAHIAESALKIGDGPEQNQFPPNVLAAISPIVDIGK